MTDAPTCPTCGGTKNVCRVAEERYRKANSALDRLAATVERLTQENAEQTATIKRLRETRRAVELMGGIEKYPEGKIAALQNALDGAFLRIRDDNKAYADLSAMYQHERDCRDEADRMVDVLCDACGDMAIVYADPVKYRGGPSYWRAWAEDKVKGADDD